MKELLKAIALLGNMTDEQADDLGRELYNERGLMDTSDMLCAPSMKLQRIRDMAVELHKQNC